MGCRPFRPARGIAWSRGKFLRCFRGFFDGEPPLKLVTFAPESGEPRTGAVVEGGILDLPEATGGQVPADMLGLMEAGVGRGYLRSARNSPLRTFAVSVAS